MYIIFFTLVLISNPSLHGENNRFATNNSSEINQPTQMTDYLQPSELAFDINLVSSKAAYQSDELPQLTAVMTNNNNFPIALMNLFCPTKDFFDIHVEYKHPEKAEYESKVPKLLHAKTAYHPTADEMWLWLQPGESFEVPIEIDDKIREKGDYKITIEYTRKILIKKQTEAPYYTEKFKWQSTQLEIKMK